MHKKLIILWSTTQADASTYNTSPHFPYPQKYLMGYTAWRNATPVDSTFVTATDEPSLKSLIDTRTTPHTLSWMLSSMTYMTTTITHLLYIMILLHPQEWLTPTSATSRITQECTTITMMNMMNTITVEENIVRVKRATQTEIIRAVKINATIGAEKMNAIKITFTMTM